jgi:hypothetical protein
MDSKILELILNSGGLALSLALLFFYSLNTFKANSTEKNEMKTDLKTLQSEFHKFKSDVIEKLIFTLDKNSDVLQHLREEIQSKLK